MCDFSSAATCFVVLNTSSSTNAYMIVISTYMDKDTVGLTVLDKSIKYCVYYVVSGIEYKLFFHT